jgi:hypothetical protein
MKNFILGFLLGVVVVLLLRNTVSFFDPAPLFSNDMTVESATTLLNKEMGKLQADYEAKIVNIEVVQDGEALKKSLEEDIVKLSMTFNGFMSKKSMAASPPPQVPT